MSEEKFHNPGRASERCHCVFESFVAKHPNSAPEKALSHLMTRKNPDFLVPSPPFPEKKGSVYFQRAFLKFNLLWKGRTKKFLSHTMSC